MPNEVLIALLPVLGTVLGSMIGVLASSKLTSHRIEQLEKKVDKHNHLVERMVVVEQSTKSAHKRLDAMEGKGD